MTTTTANPTELAWLMDAQESLTYLRNDLYDLDVHAADLRKALTQYQGFVADRTAQLRQDVCDEMNDAGKPRYSNETARGDALRLALKEDMAARRYQELIDETQGRIAQVQADVEVKLRRRQDIHLAAQWGKAWLINRAEGALS